MQLYELNGPFRASAANRATASGPKRTFIREYGDDVGPDSAGACDASARVGAYASAARSPANRDRAGDDLANLAMLVRRRFMNMFVFMPLRQGAAVDPGPSAARLRP